MSALPDHSSPESALRTRALMIGVLVGAIVAMTLTWIFSGVPGSDEAVAQDEAERRAEQVVQKREQAFRSPPGSCLSWTAADASDVAKVPCTEEHLFEVIGLADLGPEYGPKTPMPGAEDWQKLAEKHCGTLAKDYLDKPLDPEGKLTVGVLRPDQEQWKSGDRTLHCGLQWVGPGGGLQPLTKPASEMDQSYVWETGTCLGIVDKTVGDPVSCSEPHSYEIVGVADLKDEFDEFPSEEDQHAWLDPTCAEIVKEYTGGMDAKALADKGLILTWDLRSQESWDAGSTRVNCKVGALLKDDSGLAEVQGSVRASAEKEKKAEGEKSEASGSGDSGGTDSGGTSGTDSGGQDSGGTSGTDSGGTDGSGTDSSGTGDSGGTGDGTSGTDSSGTGGSGDGGSGDGTSGTDSGGQDSGTGTNDVPGTDGG